MANTTLQFRTMGRWLIMANISFSGAVSAIVEALEYRVEDGYFTGDDPDSVFDILMDWGYSALSEYIDNGLIYTADILELWDGSTHENVYVDSAGSVDLMALVTQSTFYQLDEDWSDAIYGGIDDWLTTVTGREDRADALSALTGEEEEE